MFFLIRRRPTLPNYKSKWAYALNYYDTEFIFVWNYEYFVLFVTSCVCMRVLNLYVWIFPPVKNERLFCIGKGAMTTPQPLLPSVRWPVLLSLSVFSYCDKWFYYRRLITVYLSFPIFCFLSSMFLSLS